VKKFLGVAILSLTLLSGCGDSSVDKDGVPKVDVHGTIVATTDAKAIESAKEWGLPIPSKRILSVKGKEMPIMEFILTYCQGKDSNETCARAKTIARIDSTSGPRAELPKGL